MDLTCMNRFSCRLALAISLMLTVMTAWADALPAPTGDIILSVDGKISRSNHDTSADFDLAMLDALPQSHYQTTHPWSETPHDYSGVLLRDLLSSLGATGDTVTAKALNDYQADIPVADAQNYDILLATHVDGEVMDVRHKGPVWVMYPLDQHPELKKAATYSVMVWHLRQLSVN